MATSGPHTSSSSKIHHYNQKTQMAAYFNPGADERKPSSRNHMAENRRALKEMQDALRQRRLAEQVPKPEAWKLSRFKAIRSKVADVIHQPRTPFSSSPAPPPPSAGSSSSPHHEFLRRGTLNKRMENMSMEVRSKMGSPRSEISHNSLMTGRPSTAGSTMLSPRDSECSVRSTSNTTKPAVPKHTDLAKLAPKSQKNHIVENCRSALHLHPPASARSNNHDKGLHLHESFGQVPTYLQERKQEWADEEARRRAAMPDPDCPPGMRLLTEEERIETLQALDENEAEVRRLMTRIPLQVDTPSMTRRRDALDQRLDEINKNRTLFSKPKVFIVEDGGEAGGLTRVAKE